MDLALNNLQWLIYHKIKSNQTSQNQIYPDIYLPTISHEQEATQRQF